MKSKPDDPEAVVYDSGSGAWYVKNALQVTRSIGDLFLKSEEFYDALPSEQKAFSKTRYIPPYVKWEPEVKTVEVEDEDLFFVMASDGLWDELSNKDAAESVRRAILDPPKASIRMPLARDQFKRVGKLSVSPFLSEVS